MQKFFLAFGVTLANFVIFFLQIWIDTDCNAGDYVSIIADKTRQNFFARYCKSARKLTLLAFDDNFFACAQCRMKRKTEYIYIAARFNDCIFDESNFDIFFCLNFAALRTGQAAADKYRPPDNFGAVDTAHNFNIARCLD